MFYGLLIRNNKQFWFHSIKSTYSISYLSTIITFGGSDITDLLNIYHGSMDDGVERKEAAIRKKAQRKTKKKPTKCDGRSRSKHRR